MSKARSQRKPDILGTSDIFIAAVPWGEWRTVLVFRREHGGRTYVRMRTWNRHRTRRLWYPSPRFFVIPADSAEAMAEAIRAAGRGRPLNRMPRWFKARERADRERYERLMELDAPEEVLRDRRNAIRRRERRSV